MATKIYNNPTYAAGAQQWIQSTTDASVTTLLQSVSASLAKLPYSGSKHILITSASNTF